VASNKRGVLVFDISNPAEPTFVRDVPGDSINVHTVHVDGYRLIRVLDVSNPSQPRELAHYNTLRETDPGRTDGLFEGAIGIRVPGDGYVYAVDLARGLLILPEP
jgi:hypothetical protein